MSVHTAPAASTATHAKGLHAGANILTVRYDAPTLTAATINTLIMGKVPARARIGDLKAYVANSVDDVGIYAVVLGNETIGTACIASAVTQLPTLIGKTMSTSATATALRYLELHITPTTLAASTQAIVQLTYHLD